MHLILVLPGLLDVPAAGLAYSPDLAALLADAPFDVVPDGLGAALAPHYGVARQRDWPLAALRAAALDLAPGDHYWLRAVPITLVAGREDVRVSGPAGGLDAAGAHALITRLNEHFRDDALEFVAPRVTDWFVRTPHAPDLATRSLRTVLDRPLRHRLPEGSDAARWRRWDHEIQMLLHAHPINAAREGQGQPLVNGVWFDEGGTFVPGARRAIATWSDDALAIAFARHAGGELAPLPATLEPVLAAPAEIAVVITPDVRRDDEASTRLVADARRAHVGRWCSVSILTDGRGAPAAMLHPVPVTAWRKLFGAGRAPNLEATFAAVRTADAR